MIGIDILLAVHLSIWCGVDITIFVYTNRKTFDSSGPFLCRKNVDKVVDLLMGKKKKKLLFCWVRHFVKSQLNIC